MTRSPYPWLFTALLISAVFASRSEAADAPPNIVVFLVDDMGIMDTSVPFLTNIVGKPQRYPLNDFYRTPNMDRLAARGIRFNDFSAMSVCSPTRISIATGRNAARHRTTNWIAQLDNRGPQGPPEWRWRGLGKEDVTLARLLQKSGYRTIHVGKGHFAPHGFDGADPRNLGFDVNVGGTSIGAPGSYYGKQNFDKAGKSTIHGVSGLERYLGTDIFLTEALTIEAKRHVAEAVAREKPFFLNFAHYAVHSPFESDPRFAANYRASGKSPQAQAFATLVEGMDKSLGDLLDHLETLGVADNTLIFFLGDNGSDAPLGHQHEVACAAPLRGKKGSHYEGGTRVPLIVSWAKPEAKQANQQRLPIASGAIQRQQAAVYDLFPTILQVADVGIPGRHVVDGVTLAPLLTGKPDTERPQSFLMHYPHSPHRSDYFTVYRNGPWKVIYHYFPTQVSGGSHYQLFKLDDDPYEQRDLAASNRKDLERMMQGLVLALEAQDALYPISKDDGKPVKPQLP